MISSNSSKPVYVSNFGATTPPDLVQQLLKWIKDETKGEAFLKSHGTIKALLYSPENTSQGILSKENFKEVCTIVREIYPDILAHYGKKLFEPQSTFQARIIDRFKELTTQVDAVYCQTILYESKSKLFSTKAAHKVVPVLGNHEEMEEEINADTEPLVRTSADYNHSANLHFHVQRYLPLIMQRLELERSSIVGIFVDPKVAAKFFITLKRGKNLCFEYKENELLVYLQKKEAKKAGTLYAGENTQARKALLINLVAPSDKGLDSCYEDVVIRSESLPKEATQVNMKLLNDLLKSNPPAPEISKSLCIPRLWREKFKGCLTVAKYAHGDSLDQTWKIWKNKQLKKIPLDEAKRIYQQLIATYNYFGNHNLLVTDQHGGNIKLNLANYQLSLFDFDDIHNYQDVIAKREEDKASREEDNIKDGATYGYSVCFDYRGLNRLKDILLLALDKKDKSEFTNFCKEQTLIAD